MCGKKFQKNNRCSLKSIYAVKKLFQILYFIFNKSNIGTFVQ